MNGDRSSGEKMQSSAKACALEIGQICEDEKDPVKVIEDIVAVIEANVESSPAKVQVLSKLGRLKTTINTTCSQDKALEKKIKAADDMNNVECTEKVKTPQYRGTNVVKTLKVEGKDKTEASVNDLSEKTREEVISQLESVTVSEDRAAEADDVPVDPQSSRSNSDAQDQKTTEVKGARKITFRVCNYGGCNFFESVDQRNYATHWRRHHPDKPDFSFRLEQWNEEEYQEPLDEWGLQKNKRLNPFTKGSDNIVEVLMTKFRKLCKEQGTSLEAFLRSIDSKLYEERV